MLRTAPLVIAALVLWLATLTFVSFGGVTLAINVFDDVSNEAFYHDDVTKIKSLGITAGCSAAPPLYCPDNKVTRGEMAVFQAKTAGLYRAVYDQDRVGIQNVGTSATTIASGTMEAPTACALLMSGSVEWDDDLNSNHIRAEWYVDGVAVANAPDWEDEEGGSGLLDIISVIAFKEVASGSHTVELKANAGSGTIDIWDVSMFALCVPFDGSGSLITP